MHYDGIGTVHIGLVQLSSTKILSDKSNFWILINLIGQSVMECSFSLINGLIH